ncbi:MAG TPA: hypothetical protein VGK28_04640, partial [Candidatus Dormibacteraeota bacterium]
MPRSERIKVRVVTRDGVTARRVLDTLRDYTADRNPWTVRTRRPLVLSHASRRAEGVRFEFKAVGDDLSLLIQGGGARLGLAYAATLLANARFADLISSFTVELP